MTTSASDPAAPPSANPSDPFRLRPDPPRVVRLSRKVLGGLAVITTLGIGGALIFALQDRPARDRPGELRRLPPDYSGIPQLGPALPGDLGRPILRAASRPRNPAAQPKLIKIANSPSSMPPSTVASLPRIVSPHPPHLTSFRRDPSFPLLSSQAFALTCRV